MAEILALDIGGTKIGWAVVRYLAENAPAQHDLVISASGSIATQALAGGATVMARIADLVREVHTTHPDLCGIGVASAGVVNPQTGAIISATDTMPGWGGTPLGAMLREATNLPVAVINDVHAHGLGEAILGAGQGKAVVLSLAVGTGIGGALIEAGKINFGNHFLAGHYGHVHHHYASAMQCSCGRVGHIESIASGSGITAWYNARAKMTGNTAQNPLVENGRALQDLADQGNVLAQKCFTESATALGEVLASLANSIDPTVIVLSGSMTKSGERWWEALRQGYQAGAMNAVANVPLVLGELGGQAPLLGATLNFLQHSELPQK